jgi:hypothetical protein
MEGTMKRFGLLALAFSALVALSATAWKSRHADGGGPKSGDARNPSAARETASPAARERGTIVSVADAERLRQLTEELRTKDRVIAALATGQGASADPANAKERAMDEAARVYEERLVASGTDTSVARGNERFIRKLMDELLPPGTQADLVCGATMCRMATYGVPLKLSHHLEAMVDRASKEFRATRLLPKEDEVTVYFAQSTDLLQIHPTPSAPIPADGADGGPQVTAPEVTAPAK